MNRILSRLLVRVAIALASLAWAGFVFTQTVGDPGRGERIASAVLADPDARAEVTAPITGSVMTATGVPPEHRPLVEGQVDRFLSDPQGARSFIDPFAGSWARLLGEHDPRPTEFDVAPFLAQFAVTASVPDGIVLPERLPVSGVPLPRTQLDWMDDVRAAIDAAVLPLALAAAALFAMAFAIGDRARVLRRLGVWAILAGLVWVAVPPVVVWAARRWATGADAVVSVAVDEAITGLLPVALALVVGGALATVASFAVGATPERAPAGARRPRAAAPVPRTAATTAPRRRRTTVPTAELPIVGPGPAPAAEPTTRLPASPPAGEPDLGTTDEITTRLPAPTAPRPDSLGDDRPDPLWEYYSS